MEDVASLGFSINSDPLTKASEGMEAMAASAQKAEDAVVGVGAASDKSASEIDALAAAANKAQTAVSSSKIEWENYDTAINNANNSAASTAATLAAANDEIAQSIAGTRFEWESYEETLDRTGAKTKEHLDVAAIAAEEAAAKLMDTANASQGLSHANDNLAQTSTAAATALNFAGEALGRFLSYAIATGLGILLAELAKLIDWSNLASIGLNMLADAVAWLGRNMSTVIPIIALAGVTLAVAFGPAAVAMIGGAFVGAVNLAVAAVWSLTAAILANPVAAFVAAIGAGIGIFVGWENALIGVARVVEGLIYLFEQLLNIVGMVTDRLGWTQGLSEITINFNADEAVAKIVQAASDYAQKAESALRMGADYFGNRATTSIAAGGDQAAAKIGSAMTMSADQAAAEWQRLNGTIVQEFKGALADGSSLLYNSVTGAITKATENIEIGIEKGGYGAGETMLQSMNTGGENAGQAIGRHMDGAGRAFGSDILEMIDYFAKISGDTIRTLEYLESAIEGQLQIMRATALELRASARNLVAQSKLAEAQAKLATQQALNPDRDYGGSGAGGSGSGGGGSGATFYLGPNAMERRREDARASFYNRAWRPIPDNTNDGNGSGNNNVSITNVMDPSMVPTANQSASGQRSIVNVIKANRDEINSYLGAR